LRSAETKGTEALRDFEEWDRPELVYVDESQVVRSFGYDLAASETSPETRALIAQSVKSVMGAEGSVAPTVQAYPNAEAAADAVRKLGIELGASMVGVTTVDRQHVYAGMEVPHRYAIMIALAMDYEEIKHGASERQAQEVLRSYIKVGKIAVQLAQHIRDRGYPARAHSLRFTQINMIPHARAAGLGELGKHGSLINWSLGCSFRLAAVTTDLPLVEDRPDVDGIEEVCINCNMCENHCPGDAISSAKQNIRGMPRWIVDTEKCAPYFASYLGCGICLEVCPFNARGFDGRYKQSLSERIHSIDLKARREQLRDGLQEPWTHVESPTDHSPGWRMRVRGKGPFAAIYQGLPATGLPDVIYQNRMLMGIEPPRPDGHGLGGEDPPVTDR